MQIMEHTAVNGSVHTACKQHQRVSASPSRVNGALRFPLLTLFFFFFFFFSKSRTHQLGEKKSPMPSTGFFLLFFSFLFLQKLFFRCEKEPMNNSACVLVLAIFQQNKQSHNSVEKCVLNCSG